LEEKAQGTEASKTEGEKNMGMYTGLRFRGFVKPEYREMIKQVQETAGYWEAFVEQFPFLEDFAHLPRSGMIPFGSLSYMPSEWDDNDNIRTSSFKRSIDMETGYWTFQCSLKNYNNEIDAFLSEVVPQICSSTEYIEYLYEEWDSSTLYELRNGEVVNVGKHVYREEEPNYWEQYPWGGNDE
jgi:hypothetical protein